MLSVRFTLWRGWKILSIDVFDGCSVFFSTRDEYASNIIGIERWRPDWLHQIQYNANESSAHHKVVIIAAKRQNIYKMIFCVYYFTPQSRLTKNSQKAYQNHKLSRVPQIKEILQIKRKPEKNTDLTNSRNFWSSKLLIRRQKKKMKDTRRRVESNQKKALIRWYVLWWDGNVECVAGDVRSFF